MKKSKKLEKFIIWFDNNTILGLSIMCLIFLPIGIAIGWSLFWVSLVISRITQDYF